MYNSTPIRKTTQLVYRNWQVLSIYNAFVIDEVDWFTNMSENCGLNNIMIKKVQYINNLFFDKFQIVIPKGKIKSMNYNHSFSKFEKEWL